MTVADDQRAQAQRDAWDEMIWQTIVTAEDTSRPYPRTDGTAYGFPAFMAAEGDLMAALHEQANMINNGS